MCADDVVRKVRFLRWKRARRLLNVHAMKILKTKKHVRFFAILSGLMLANVPAHAVWPPPGVVGDELAVWYAMAGNIARDNSAKPYKLWYYQSDFAAASFIVSAMADPDREDFCGLSGPASQAMIAQLKAVNADPVVLEPETAENAGFKLAHKKNPRFRYFAMSRVVFDPKGDSAWVSVELNGEHGSIVRLDKIEGEWKRTSRCGGWYMPE